MKIAVLLKRVPDLAEDLEVDDQRTALAEDSVTLKLNEFDDHALEEALLLKESAGGEVTVLALDGEEVDKILFTALAKGADRAMKVTGADDARTNRALSGVFAAVLAGQPFDLILTGVQAVDDRDGQLGPMVAARAGLPSVEVVTGVTPGAGFVTLQKEYAGGVIGEFEVDLPAVLGIQAARQPPRYAPVSKIRQMQQSTTLELLAHAPDADPPFAVLVMTPPKSSAGAQMLSGVDELMRVLEAKGVLS